MAPETIADPTRVGPAADVYGLGRTLGWLVTGIVPRDLEELDAPEPWSEIVARMTALDWRDRISTMTEVIAELCRVLAGLREREAGRAKPHHGGLNGQDERVLATVVERACEPARSGGNMYVTSYELRDVSIPRSLLLVSLWRLISLGYLAQADLRTQDESTIAHYLLEPTWHWAAENCDRLPELILPPAPPPPPMPPPDPSNIPF